MKRKFLFTLLFLFSLLVNAQDDPSAAKLQKGYELYGQKQYSSALAEFKSILYENPEHPDANMGVGLCYVDMGNYAEGRKYLETGYYLEPLNNTILRCLAYLEILERKDLNKAKEWMTKAMMTFGNVNEIQLVETDCNDYAKTYSPSLFNALKNFAYERYYQENNGLNIKKAVSLLAEAQGLIQSSRPKEAKQKFDQILVLMKASSEANKEFIVRLYHLYAQLLISINANNEAAIFLKDGYAYYFSSGANHPYQLVLLSKNLCRHYNSYGQTTNVLAVLDKVIPISLNQPYSNQTADLYMEKISARFNLYSGENDKSQYEGLITDCNKLLQIAGSCGNLKTFYEAQANNTLCAVYLMSSNPGDRLKAASHGETALKLAQQNNMEYLIDDIQSNLSIIYFQNKEYSKALSLSKEIIEKQKKNKKYLDASLTLNNMGSMLYYGGKYEEASGVFKQAVQLVEDFRSQVPQNSKVDFLHQQISSYQFLSMCYAKLGKANELYETFEKSRGRQLAERISLGKNLPSASPEWVQQNLKPDEAVLMYGMGEPGSIAILVITKEQIKVINKEVPDFHEKLKQQFKEDYGFTMKLRDQESVLVDPFELQKKDDIGKVISILRTMITKTTGSIEVYEKINKDMLGAFYDLLVQPAEILLEGKKKVFISPDSYLSFVPFDALMDKQGKYLAEKMVVQYVPSMTVWRLLKTRSFPESRKNMLAFGGALYEPYFISVSPLSTLGDFYQLHYKVNENSRYNYSQRKAYASLGVTGKSWVYLPGTLEEVKGISIGIKGVTAYTGKDFTENFIKSLSASGELSKYKVLHLATHGMSVPSVPELSAVIASLPLQEYGGEDGYLTVEEVKNLKLQADFVALSACETGLGKIYSGEGVIGLTQSFLQAGSNAISVSLWAISDDATTKFMIGYYDLVFNKKMTYAEAMAEMKRKFIKGEFGEQYKYPKYWAPFVYYGL